MFLLCKYVYLVHESIISNIEYPGYCRVHSSLGKNSFFPVLTQTPFLSSTETRIGQFNNHRNVSDSVFVKPKLVWRPRSKVGHALHRRATRKSPGLVGSLQCFWHDPKKLDPFIILCQIDSIRTNSKLLLQFEEEHLLFDVLKHSMARLSNDQRASLFLLFPLHCDDDFSIVSFYHASTTIFHQDN